MKISATIVIYNENKEVLKKAIESFLSLNFKKELVIVDNSPSNYLEDFCKSFKDVKYIYSGKNLGFGKGHNLGFKSLSIISDYHLVINPDIWFEKKEIKAFLLWLDNQKDISLAIPKILNEDGTTQKVVRNIPTPISLIKRKLGLDLDEIEIQDKSITEIPFAHGSFLVFPSYVFKKLNGFDERFFMYMEDVDIFVRAKKYGKTIINTNYSVYHKWNRASSKNFKLLYHHIISAIKFFIKNK